MIAGNRDRPAQNGSHAQLSEIHAAVSLEYQRSHEMHLDDATGRPIRVESDQPRDRTLGPLGVKHAVYGFDHKTMRGNMNRFVVLVTLLVMTQFAQAQDQELDCSDSSQMTQLAMNLCSFQDYQDADAALNRIWPDALARMKSIDEYNRQYHPEMATAEQNLLKAQRAWIDVRDGHCEALGAQYAGGSIRPLIINSCMAEFTQRRIQELTQVLEEG